MEDKGAAASGVEVTEEGRETYERGREHRVDLPLGESEVRDPKVLPKTTSAANSFEIFAFSVVTLLGCGLKQFLLFSTPHTLSSSVLES